MEAADTIVEEKEDEVIDNNMLEFENQILLDLIHEDGLVVAAKGLGVEDVLINLLKVYCDPGNLVLVLGTRNKEEEYFMERLKNDGVSCPPRIVTTETSPAERHVVYFQAGVLFVTPRILVVDMLKDRVPIELITGIVVYRAHDMVEACQESFILRLYRQKNKSGFIKAFSSNPQAFTVGFSQIAKVMRNLFVRNLYLWPRFHATVMSTMENAKPSLIELHLKMTPKMLAIQVAVMDLLSFVLKELRRLNPMLDNEELTVENAVLNSFHKSLQLQLDLVWHQLSAKTKQLVADVKTLQSVLIALTQYDCITFHNHVSALGTQEKAMKNSGWMLLNASEVMFVQAKERVCGEKPEVNPKWLVVSEILEEIKKKKEEQTENSPLGSTKVLIAARDAHTCHQIRDYLTHGADAVLKRLFDKAFASKLDPVRSEPKPKRRKIEKNQVTLTQMQRDEDGDAEETPPKQDFTVIDPVVIIQPFKEYSDPFRMNRLFEEIQPEYIILYDADVTFVRQVEVYQCRRPDIDVKVYFMVYAGAVEEQAYLTALRKEKQAFEYLIKEKATMVIPEEQDGLGDDNPLLLRNVKKASDAAVNTRKGGGGEDEEEKRKVLVDMREFRSELPSLIHRRGIDIEPVTLDIGDYILSPDICVERKSISDLIGSLNSGRLYNQAQTMVRHYSRPLLLIEFDHTKSFSLQGKYYLSKDISTNDVTAKLQLLTLHFPQLRIVWSPSPYATAEIFDDMKKNREQPDSTKVPLVTPESSGEFSGKYNSVCHDLVAKLPGINSKNLDIVLRNGGSLSELCAKSQEDLSKMLGNSINADALHKALHQSLKQESLMGSSANDSNRRKRFGKNKKNMMNKATS